MIPYEESIKKANEKINVFTGQKFNGLENIDNAEEQLQRILVGENEQEISEENANSMVEITGDSVVTSTYLSSGIFLTGLFT